MLANPPVPFGVDRLREVDLPTQPVVEGQLRREAPGVLSVEEPALLPLGRIVSGRQIGVVDVARK